MNKTKFVGLVLSLTLGFAQVALATPAEHQDVCPHGNPHDTVRCHAQVMVGKNGRPVSNPFPNGFGPAQLLGAYNLSGLAPTTQIIAIVDAYGDTNALSDLNVYSAKFGIPQMSACTGAAASSPTPCFSKVDQTGGTNYPAVNAGWALETSLDIEVAHAICQNCSILLVQANSSGFDDLMQAVDTAVTLGANEISNSYGSANEFGSETTFDSHFNHPGIAITVSAGDSGYGMEYPAASSYVTSVGGTSLTVNANNTYSSETVWSGTGSGCSSVETLKPFGQPTIANCVNRVVADVSAVADPATGAVVYDSTPYNGSSGWMKVGGTSLSSPLIAAVYALAGGVPAGVQGNTIPYAHAGSLHDVTSGVNGNCGTGLGKHSTNSPLCSAVVGFDGPTGMGTPNGIGAF